LPISLLNESVSKVGIRSVDVNEAVAIKQGFFFFFGFKNMLCILPSI
jgi:hypothetical protein